MKLLSLQHWGKVQAGLLPNDLEAATLDSDNDSVKDEQVVVPVITVKEKLNLVGATVVGVLFVFFATFLAVYHLFPPHVMNTNPTRMVRLNKVDGGYGLTLDGNKIYQVAPGSPADLEGKLKRGDAIININGVTVTGMHVERIRAILDTRDADVKIIVQNRAPEATQEQRFDNAMIFATIVCLIILAFSLLIIIMRPTGSARVVVLTKSEEGYGLKIDGGYVDKVAKGGPAECQGGLKKGDQVVAINGVRLLMLNNDTIKELLETRDSDVKLAMK